MTKFDESKHPRDEDGKFSSKGTSKEYRQNTSYAEILGDVNGKKILKSGGKSGALDPTSKRARRHALRMYNEIYHRTTDCAKISKITNISLNEVQEIKEYIFVPTKTYKYKNKYGDEFHVDYYQSESWRRLSEGDPIEMDIIFIKHEQAELKLRKQGLNYNQAHRIVEEKYNYKKAVDDWEANYDKDGKKRRRKR